MCIRDRAWSSPPRSCSPNGEQPTSRLVRITPYGWSIEHGRPLHSGRGHEPYRDLAAPLFVPILFDMGLCRVPLRIDRLLTMAIREVGMVRGVFVMFGGCLVMGYGLF